MTDYFALLEEPRLPWLDPDRLKSKFISLSSGVHPDRVHGASDEEKREANQRYAQLNAAYNTLREPKDRLLHLLELELETRPKDVQRIPAGTMDLFVQVGQICRDTDSFLSQKSDATSPVMKVQRFEEGMKWMDKLNEVQRLVNEKRDALTVELQAMNPIFESAPARGASSRREGLPLERLEQLYRAFSYVSRWTSQVQERSVQLSSDLFAG